MSARPALRAALLALVAGLPFSAAANQPGTTAAFEVGADSLSNGSADWVAATARITERLGEGKVIDLALGGTRRFGLTDRQLALAYTTPLAPGLIGTIDAGVSSGNVLARDAAGVLLQYEFAKAWLVHGGLRSSGYQDVRVNQGLLTLERYTGNVSMALSWRPTRAFATTVHGVAAQGAWYYADASSLGIVVSSGREASSVPGGVAIGKVQGLALVGKHQFSPSWSLTYAAARTRQVGLYNRTGLSLGLARTY